MSDFRTELPVADVQIGPASFIRIYGYADITPCLVEVHVVHGVEQILRLCPHQAEEIGRALIDAAKKARGDAS